MSSSLLSIDDRLNSAAARLDFRSSRSSPRCSLPLLRSRQSAPRSWYRRPAPRCLSSCSTLGILCSFCGFTLSVHSGLNGFRKAPTVLTASTLDLPMLLTPTEYVDKGRPREGELTPPSHPGFSSTFVITSQRHAADRLSTIIAEDMTPIRKWLDCASFLHRAVKLRGSSPAAMITLLARQHSRRDVHRVCRQHFLGLISGTPPLHTHALAISRVELTFRCR
eukprot:6213476-Pleurochrysis_carterae.AAC.4